MVKLSVIQGGRKEMGQQALSAILRNDTAAFDDIMSKMRPRSPAVSVIAGGVCGAETVPGEKPVSNQQDAGRI